jgi:hypothetical protein
MFPDFLIIGAQKSGTTWLYHNLKQHPDIWLPPVKEIHYFNFKQKNNMDRRILKICRRHWQMVFREQIVQNLKDPNFKDILWNFRFFMGKPSDSWYESLFDFSERRVTGDITPDYCILTEENVKYLHRLMPKTKILLIMRNPIERAWSYAVMQIKLDGKSLDRVSEEQLLKLCTNETTRLKGNYLRAIKIWREVFSEEQFLTAFFEEIKYTPENLMSRILNFLDLEASEEFISGLEKGKIFASGNTGIIPPKIAARLAEDYYLDIKNLNRIYGGYTDNWLDYAEKILKSTHQLHSS